MTTERDDAAKPTDLSTPTGAGQPFMRRQVQWGRPPSTVFHAGPLPKASTTHPMFGLDPDAAPAPVPARVPAPVPASGGSILTGSMIPRAAPRSTPAPAREPVVEVGEPEWVKAPVAVPARAEVPTPTPAALIDPTVRPLPAASRPTVEPLPELPIAPAAVETTRAVEVPVQVETAPVVAPSYARPRAKRSRTPLYVGAAVVVLAVVAGGVWLTVRPGAPEAPSAAAVTPPVVTAPPVIAEVAPTSPESVAEAAPSPAPLVFAPVAPFSRAAEPRAAVTRPAVVPARATPTPAASAPRAVQPARAAAAPTPQRVAPPAIVVQPLTVTPAPSPPPTAARPTQTDPDAPISTRPQPLD
ncbi:hypothetical protein BH09PSE1_BH09PSE1_07160 [soil metagenome]